MSAQQTEAQKQRTIADFGEQWTIYTGNDGFYASQELWRDILGPLVPVEEIAGRHALDIGSGTGRIVMMLLEAGAAQVTAVEPSAASAVLQQNVAEYGDKVQILTCAGDELPEGLTVDFACSIGVLHHIPNPAPVVQAVAHSLAPGGRFAVWLYGHEGNELYLAVVKPLRKITKRLPHRLLAGLVWAIYAPLVAYHWLCRWLDLPLKDYLQNVLFRMAPDKRRLVIYDQLNPAYAKYYTRAEAEALLANNGFTNVRLHHRRGYSWTVVGEKR